MPRNGNGAFTVLNPILIGQLRSSAAVNADFADAGDELTNSLPVDGSAAMLGQFSAAEGTLQSPGISFVEDVNSGFALLSQEQVSWIAGATERARVTTAGKLVLLNGIEVTGSVNISSVIAPQMLSATGQVPLTVRREENDTSPYEITGYESGDGSGAKGSLEIIGSASNNVSAVRFLVNSAEIFRFSQEAFRADAGMQVGSALSLNNAGFIDIAELSVAPSAPPANIARIYCRDVSGTSTLFYKPSTGTETSFRPTTDRQTFTSSGTWSKPSGKTMAKIEGWGGGGAGQSDGGGGGGGGYNSRVVALASLSASVSVTVAAASSGAGGTSSFGAYLTAYGGGRGGVFAFGGGGGGGGSRAAGSNGANPTGGTGGLPRGELAGLAEWGSSGDPNPFGGAGGGSSPSGDGDQSLYGGGGGGGATNINANFGGDGGSSVWGGGGGGGGGDGLFGSGGTSVFGGNGSAAGNGTAPGGGGGGNAGNGARGEIRITCW